CRARYSKANSCPQWPKPKPFRSSKTEWQRRLQQFDLGVQQFGGSTALAYVACLAEFLDPLRRGPTTLLQKSHEVLRRRGTVDAITLPIVAAVFAQQRECAIVFNAFGDCFKS